MSEWIANNREVFLVTYTQIGSSHQQALDLQSEHNQFAMSAMVRSCKQLLGFYCCIKTEVVIVLVNVSDEFI